MVKRIVFGFLIIFVLILAGSYIYLSNNYPNTSPLLTGKYYIESALNPHAQLDKHILGFLPYWRLDDIDTIRPELLSEINYFSLTPTNEGKIKSIITGETDPGYRGWTNENLQNFKTKSQIAGTDFTVTIAALSNELIESILISETAQQTLTTEIISLIKNHKLNGVTIDFEYTGEPDAVYKQAFTDFSKKLSNKMQSETPKAHLSLSLMPRAARDPDIYDFPKLIGIYDRFIGMSYDYYGISADIAGPVAPMKGFKEKKYFFDVVTTYEDYLNYIPKEKIVMGVPYYGWERAVKNGKEKNSLTYPTDHAKHYAAVISYARARETKDFKSTDCSWDELAQETWCRYTKDGTDYQVWLADNKSIGVRFDYANNAKLGGIAIWVLGYDKQHPDLWEMINKNFTSR